MSPAVLASLDLFLRGGVCTLLLGVAALLLRDFGRSTAARLAALFAVSAAAYAIVSLPGLHDHIGPWGAPLIALSAGDSLVFWLFARRLFDDGFRLRPRHLVLWAGVVGVVGFNHFALEPIRHPLVGVIGLFAPLQALAFAVLAGAQTMASWRADLVEPRRRLRVFVVAAAALHTVLSGLAALARDGAQPAPGAALFDAAGILAIAAVVAWSLLSVGGGAALFGAPEIERDAPVAGLDPADQPLARALERAMREDRAYRRETLSIGRLAHDLGVPEHRLRRVINQGLGYRNFNAFLNGYRIAEARAALADPSQDEVPILTIALDAGFNSLGPFNRAFKAETGLTPTAFRRDRAPADSATGSPKFEIGVKGPGGAA